MTCLVRFEHIDPTRAIGQLRARLDQLGATPLPTPFTCDTVLLEGTDKAQQKWLRVVSSDVEGPLLYNYNTGSPLPGQLEGVAAALASAGVSNVRPVASVAGKSFVMDDWRIGVGVLQPAKGPPSRIVVVSLRIEAHRSRCLGSYPVFSQMVVRLLGKETASKCMFAFHDTTPPLPTPATVSPQYNRAHLCVAWITLQQAEIKALQ